MLAHDPLRVSLADLLSADTKGKWWLVGAAWGGNPLVDHAAAAKTATKTITLEAEEDDLMKLARKQGMNTDVRRRVFVVIMSSTVSIGRRIPRTETEQEVDLLLSFTGLPGRS